MRLTHLLTALALLALVAFTGCQDDENVTSPTQTDLSSTSLVRGTIAGTADFEFLSASATDSPDARPGPFLIRGYDVRYDDELGALLVDLTATNVGAHMVPEPASLTFVSLLPDTITVLNADNGETGPGAMFELGFANDDAQWTPGEESFPFTVHFGVSEVVSIGFVARVDVGMVPGGGTLGGVVWHDMNENGMIDEDEVGLPDIAIGLAGPLDYERLVLTGPDGEYRFDGLPAGYYTVTRLPHDYLVPTTPLRIQVVLVMDDEGEVSDFMAANFGCLVVDMPPEDGIEVGDCIHVKGDYGGDPARLEVDHYCDCDNDDDDDDDKHECWSRLAGPITGFDRENHAVWVMGSMLHITDDTRMDLDEIEIGDRVNADVTVRGDGEDRVLVACRLRPFEGNWDRVRGTVSRVGTDEEGHVMAMIMGVIVDLTNADECDEQDA